MKTNKKETTAEYDLPEARIYLKQGTGLLSHAPVNSVQDAISLMTEALSRLDREYCCTVNLDAWHRPINFSIISIGTLTEATADPVNIFKPAILSNAQNYILMHCHPSGSVQPSQEDIDLTRRLAALSSLLGTKMVDHIIVAGGSGESYSFMENMPEIFTDKYTLISRRGKEGVNVDTLLPYVAEKDEEAVFLMAPPDTEVESTVKKNRKEKKIKQGR